MRGGEDTTMGFPIQTHENNIAHITKAHCGANIKALGNNYMELMVCTLMIQIYY